MSEELRNKSEKYKLKKNDVVVSLASTHSITLISLVITIVILIILAGIVINLSIGENGLFKKAKQAKNDYLTAAEREQEVLNELYMQLGIEGKDLPENTPETEAGTLVKTPDNWYVQTPTIYKMPELQEIEKTVKVASVYAVSDGKNNTVPIPYGFFYVGGNIDTGVVISDNEKDKNKYKNVADGKVPSGIKTVEEKDEEGNIKYKLENELLGNQFVWIPCTEEEYHKTSWGQGNVGTICYGYWDTTTNSAEMTQIKKYGGFYVGRYEACLPEGTEEYYDALKYNDTKYNYEGIPEVKSGRIPWHFIDWENSQKNARKMYEKSEIASSGLITGTQWDVMIKKIEEKEGKNLTDSLEWGNYKDADEFTYTGRVSECLFSDYKQYPFGDVMVNEIKEAGKRYLLTTGASNHNRAYNVYDIAGNLSEWTEEGCVSSTISSIQTAHCMRGGSANYSTNPVCTRDIGNYSAQSEFGFRIVLYIK